MTMTLEQAVEVIDTDSISMRAHVYPAWQVIKAHLSAQAKVQVTLSDEMVARYVSAVNDHLGRMTESDWEIERLDPSSSISRVARIGLCAVIDFINSGGKNEYH
jgi:hypothetical protein